MLYVSISTFLVIVNAFDFPKIPKIDPPSSYNEQLARVSQGWDNQASPQRRQCFSLQRFRPKVSMLVGRNTTLKELSVDLLRQGQNSVDVVSSRISWEGFACSEANKNIWQQALGFKNLSHVQARIWPRVFQRESFVVGDQSRSGKTLGYISSIVEQIVNSTTKGPRSTTTRQTTYPYALIITPTSAHAKQVFDLFKIFLSGFGLHHKSVHFITKAAHLKSRANDIGIISVPNLIKLEKHGEVIDVSKLRFVLVPNACLSE